MIWVSDENGVDKTVVCYWLLNVTPTRSRISASHTAPPMSRLEVHKEMKGDTDRKAEGLPHHMRFYSAIKAVGKNRKGGMLSDVFIFLSNHDA